VTSGDRQGVRVEGQHRQRSQDEVALGEGYVVRAAERDATGGAHRVDASLHLFGLERFGNEALQAKENGRHRAVSGPGGRQRAEEVHSDVDRVVERAERLQVGNESRGGPHRPHRVRTRRSDADREQFEHADRHETALLSCRQCILRSSDFAGWREARSG
jgi:hypothetical protein